MMNFLGMQKLWWKGWLAHCLLIVVVTYSEMKIQVNVM